MEFSACQLKGSGGFGVGSVAIVFVGLGLWFCASLRLLVSALWIMISLGVIWLHEYRNRPLGSSGFSNYEAVYDAAPGQRLDIRWIFSKYHEHMPRRSGKARSPLYVANVAE